MTNFGLEQIKQERERQKSEEGWSFEHDLEHHGDEVLVAAAECYETADEATEQPDTWPWESHWWKPKDKVRNLERAGALYLAAVDVANHVVDKNHFPGGWHNTATQKPADDYVASHYNKRAQRYQEKVIECADRLNQLKAVDAQNGVGHVLRYSNGETALFVPSKPATNGRYYGVQCMGHSKGADVSQCRFASTQDLIVWDKNASWREEQESDNE